jgi:hypothetical protein
MKNSNLIKWSFWPILVAVILIGYTCISAEAVNKHLDFIPSNAKAVVILDSKYLANDFYELLKFNPTKIDEVLPLIEGTGDAEIATELPGIVPLGKMAFYIYQDTETKDQQFFRCFIATLSDKSQFLKTMNGMRENAIVTEIESGNIHFYKEDNKLVLIKNDVVVVVEPFNNAFKLSSSIGKRHYLSVFSNSSQSLIAKSHSFKETVNQKNHVNVWAANGEGILEGFGGSMIGINKLFNSQIISINLKDEDIETKVHLYLNEKDLIIEKSNDVKPLNEQELLRLSMSLNPDKFKDYFQTLLPSDKYFLADGWTGQVCTSVIGFRNQPVYQLKPDTIIDNIKRDTLIKIDTIELSRFVNLPHFVLAIELEDAKTVGELLKIDSTIPAKDGYFSLKIPNLINENVYIKIAGNNLLLSSTPLGFNYKPVYSTFAFNMDIEGLISNYPPKDMLQALLIPTINKFDFKSFEMYYDTMNDDYICLNGKLKLGKEDIHSLLKFVPFAFNMASNF